MVAQAFQPVLAQAKACGYKNNPLIATWYQGPGMKKEPAMISGA
jgi:hypothetical protein